MLASTQLIGFGAADQDRLPAVRFVGAYAYNFAGTVTAVATILAADLGTPYYNKQLLVIVRKELITLNGITFTNASNPGLLLRSYTGLMDFFGVRVDNVGPIVVTLTAAAANAEIGVIEVYEIRDGEELDAGMKGFLVSGAASIHNCLDGSALIGAHVGLTDTATYTWAGAVTEITDLDGGDYRYSSAARLTPRVGTGLDSITPTVTAGTSGGLYLQVRPRNKKFLRRAMGGGTYTFLNYSVAGLNLFTLGAINARSFPESYRLVVAFYTRHDVTITGVTVGGVAMTLLGSVINAASVPDVGIYVFGINVATGNVSPGQIDVTLSGVAAAGSLQAASFYALYNTTGNAAAQSVQGNATGAAIVVTNFPDDGYVLGWHVRNAVAAGMGWTGIERGVSVAVGGVYSVMDGHRANSAPAAGVSVTGSGAVANQYATLIIPFTH